jgi:ectoine hydroxylase-related dioxygenase (phytanoyl-CoA dioxygenase family)
MVQKTAMKPLSSDQVESYRQHGFLVVREVFGNSDLETFRLESDRLWKLMELDQSNRRIQWRNRVDGGRTADRLDPVLDISPAFEIAAREPLITTAVGQLLRHAVPEIFKSKLISKWPQTTGYALHQDYTYWPGLGNASPDDFVTALIALDRSDTRSGALVLFPGLHHCKLPPPPGNARDVDEKSVDPSKAVRPDLNPGDVVFFHSMTPHRSDPNFSPHNRQSLFFTYVAPGYDDLSRQYYAERPDDFMEPE